MAKSDIIFVSGAVHDDVGPVTSFAPNSPAGQIWFDENSIDGSYVIEDDQVELTLACIEAVGLTARAA